MLSLPPLNPKIVAVVKPKNAAIPKIVAAVKPRNVAVPKIVVVVAVKPKNATVKPRNVKPRNAVVPKIVVVVVVKPRNAVVKNCCNNIRVIAIVYAKCCN